MLERKRSSSLSQISTTSVLRVLSMQVRPAFFVLQLVFGRRGRVCQIRPSLSAAFEKETSSLTLEPLSLCLLFCFWPLREVVSRFSRLAQWTNERAA